MLWFRIDNRLVHGQVIETWLPHVRAKVLLVANDELAQDELRQEIMSLAVPSHVRFICCPVAGLESALRKALPGASPDNAVILFATCEDARAAHMAGLTFDMVNIGNLHYGPGKEQVCEHIALSADDRTCLQYFNEHGVEIDFRCVPSATAKITL